LFDSPPPKETNEEPTSPGLDRPPAPPQTAAEPPGARRADTSALASKPTSSFTPSVISSGEKGKARDILAAIRALKRVQEEKRPGTVEEREVLSRFAGFGPVALSIFPDPVTGRYKDRTWQALGEELKTLLTPEEYESAKRTTFNAFYTSPTVIRAI